MKKFLKGVLAITVLFSATGSFAQAPKQSPQERAWAQSQTLKEKLGLSNEQNQKVFNILFQSAKQEDQAANPTQGSGKSLSMQDIRKNRDTQIKSFLTPDQIAKYQAQVPALNVKN